MLPVYYWNQWYEVISNGMISGWYRSRKVLIRECAKDPVALAFDEPQERSRAIKNGDTWAVWISGFPEVAIFADTNGRCRCILAAHMRTRHAGWCDWRWHSFCLLRCLLHRVANSTPSEKTNTLPFKEASNNYSRVATDGKENTVRFVHVCPRVVCIVLVEANLWENSSPKLQLVKRCIFGWPRVKQNILHRIRMGPKINVSLFTYSSWRKITGLYQSEIRPRLSFPTGTRGAIGQLYSQHSLQSFSKNLSFGPQISAAVIMWHSMAVISMRHLRASPFRISVNWWIGEF